MKDDVVFSLAATWDYGECFEALHHQGDLYHNFNHINAQFHMVESVLLLVNLADYNTQCFYPEKDIALSQISYHAPKFVKVLRDGY